MDTKQLIGSKNESAGFAYLQVPLPALQGIEMS